MSRRIPSQSAPGSVDSVNSLGSPSIGRMGRPRCGCKRKKTFIDNWGYPSGNTTQLLNMASHGGFTFEKIFHSHVNVHQRVDQSPRVLKQCVFAQQKNRTMCGPMLVWREHVSRLNQNGMPKMAECRCICGAPSDVFSFPSGAIVPQSNLYSPAYIPWIKNHIQITDPWHFNGNHNPCFNHFVGWNAMLHGFVADT